ncbi:unnamed protein product [Phytophthora lilii]|uniref:Unnamed protein product n=1 Tax=Phytophthora lilii TaxID=2077276 RepID=A0A9W6YLN4_9STRA|nr:unnamed protein product [Phytophthora lilii]
MARKVWFQLVDEQSRRAFLGFRTISVTSDAVNDIEDLRKKIHAEYDHTQPPGTDVVARVAAGQLRIYANRAAYDAMKEPLEEDLLIGTLGGSKKNALVVEVPTQRHVDTVWKELKPLMPDEKRQRTEAVDPRHMNELNALVAIAHKLSGAK